MGRRRKEKNCIHPASMFTSNPPVPSFAPTACSILLFLVSILFSCLHALLLLPPPLSFADQNRLTPSQLFSSFALLLLSLASIVFCIHSYHIKRSTFLHLRARFHAHSLHAHLPERIFLFVRILSGEFFTTCFHMCSYECVCLCVLRVCVCECVTWR